MYAHSSVARTANIHFYSRMKLKKHEDCSTLILPNHPTGDTLCTTRNTSNTSNAKKRHNITSLVKLTSQNDAQKASQRLQINRLPSEFSRANYLSIHWPPQTLVLHQHHRHQTRRNSTNYRPQPTRFSSLLNKASFCETSDWRPAT